MFNPSESLHLNYAVIAGMIEEHSKVLDLGCGNGELLKMLTTKRHCRQAPATTLGMALPGPLILPLPEKTTSSTIPIRQAGGFLPV